MINGADNSKSTISVGSPQDALAINPATNKIYVIRSGANRVTVLDGGTGTVTANIMFGTMPSAIAINEIMNRIYVTNLFSENVSVIDGSNNTTTTIPVGLPAGTSGGPISVNQSTNKIYGSFSNPATLIVIDGSNNSTTNVAGGTSPTASAVNPVTNKVYVNNFLSNNVTVITPAPTSAIPLNTAITPLAGNTTTTNTTTFTLTATSSYTPTAPQPRNIYFQIDTTNGAWTRATNTGNTATTLTVSATTPPLQPGIHTIYFFATDGSDATSINQARMSEAPESSPVIGGINAYQFLVNAPPVLLGFEGDLATRPNGDGSLLSNDIVQQRRFVSGLDTPSANPNEFQRSDTSPRSTLGDGLLTSTDVVQSRRYVSGLDPQTDAGGPPVAAARPSLAAEIGGSLFGSKFGQQSLLRLSSGKGGAVVELESGGEVAAVSFTVRYDAVKLGKPVVSLGNLPEGAVLTVNDRVEGELTILIDSAGPLGLKGQVLRLVELSFQKGSPDSLFHLDGGMSVSDLYGNDVPVLAELTYPVRAKKARVGR